jgi:hypothetical protein
LRRWRRRPTFRPRVAEALAATVELILARLAAVEAQLLAGVQMG